MLVPFSKRWTSFSSSRTLSNFLEYFVSGFTKNSVEAPAPKKSSSNAGKLCPCSVTMEPAGNTPSKFNPFLYATARPSSMFLKRWPAPSECSLTIIEGFKGSWNLHTGRWQPVVVRGFGTGALARHCFKSWVLVCNVLNSKGTPSHPSGSSSPFFVPNCITQFGFSSPMARTVDREVSMSAWACNKCDHGSSKPPCAKCTLTPLFHNTARPFCPNTFCATSFEPCLWKSHKCTSASGHSGRISSKMSFSNWRYSTSSSPKATATALECNMKCHCWSPCE
mmetsp:Transcript_51150/g.147609  ORF Transcript_51150/g.147609 Transcript_51150/m.147609 type:complete len:279 (-) Transcript_51150:434-1270(-)